jgi:hypothetical protein
VLINNISGTASDQWITFRGQSGDSSLATLNYQDPNLNDYTLSLSGVRFIKFLDLGILRTNGTDDILIQSGSSFVNFEHCNTGKIAAEEETNNESLAAVNCFGLMKVTYK